MEPKELNNAASNKAFAKVTMLKVDIDQLKNDVDHKRYGAISEEELKSCLESSKKQLKIWSYIFNLIEKDEI